MSLSVVQYRPKQSQASVMKLFIILAIASFWVVGVLTEEGLRSGGYGSKGSIIGLSRGIEIGRGHRGEGEEEGGGGGEEREEREHRWMEEGRRGGGGGGGGGGGEEGRREELYGIGWGGSKFITPVDLKHEEVIRLKARPEYHYDYRVRDHKTKDYKSKWEDRDGYRVKGRYSLLEPDRKTVRVVDYTSDKKRGFVAKVTWRRHDD